MAGPRWIVAGVAMLGLITEAHAFNVQFDDLIKRPAKFNGKTISVVGLLQVAGDNNYLWRDAESCQRLNLKDCIFVVNDMSRPSYPGTNLSIDAPLNYRWVRLTAVVDTSFHGRFGSDPFGLIQKQIDPLARPRERELLEIQGWFKNDTRRPVDIDVKCRAKKGSWEETFPLDPGELAPVTLVDGDNVVTAKQNVAKSLAKLIITLPGWRRYYDSRKKSYYFRILEGHIQPVLPNQAKNWSLVMPDRD